MSRRLPVVAVACVLAGCGTSEPIQRASADELRVAAPSVAETVLTVDAKGCDGTRRVSRPFDAFVVTGRQCLSCMDVGYASRRVARDARARQASFVVVAPAGDSSAVCRTLRRERTAGAVMLIPDHAVPWKDKVAPLLYLRVSHVESEAPKAIVAGDGVALIDSITAADNAVAVSP